MGTAHAAPADFEVARRIRVRCPIRRAVGPDLVRTSTPNIVLLHYLIGFGWWSLTEIDEVGYFRQMLFGYARVSSASEFDASVKCAYPQFVPRSRCR